MIPIYFVIKKLYFVIIIFRKTFKKSLPIFSKKTMGSYLGKSKTTGKLRNSIESCTYIVRSRWEKYGKQLTGNGKLIKHSHTRMQTSLKYMFGQLEARY